MCRELAAARAREAKEQLALESLRTAQQASALALENSAKELAVANKTREGLAINERLLRQERDLLVKQQQENEERFSQVGSHVLRRSPC